MKELQILKQKLELEQLTAKEKLKITKRIIQLEEEDAKETKHSIYHSLLMLVDNQIELEGLIAETFDSFEMSLNRSHNEIMKTIKESNQLTQKEIGDLKKNSENIQKIIEPLIEERKNNKYMLEKINKAKGLTLSIAGMITAGGIILAFIRYIILQ
jgi:hypothetical protein